MIKTINNDIKVDSGLSVRDFLKEKDLSSIELYVKELEFTDRSPLTIAKYAQNLRAYGEWLGGEAVSKKSAEAFLHFLKQQGWTWSTVKSYYHALKPFLRHVGIELNVTYQKHRHLPTAHDVGQVQAILEMAQSRVDKWGKLGKRDTLIILMFAYTGVRRAELLSLCVRDINFHTRMIRVRGKGDKERVIPMADCLYEKLQEYTKTMKVTDRIFPIGFTRINTMIKKYARKAGISDFTPHGFRHYFATQLILNGVDIRKVQLLLGHASIETTALYLDITGKGLEDAVTKLPDLMRR